MHLVLNDSCEALVLGQGSFGKVRRLSCHLSHSKQRCTQSCPYCFPTQHAAVLGDDAEIQVADSSVIWKRVNSCCVHIQVYKARWNGVLVAVKALNNGAQEVGDELQKEAIILSSLRHPHIVKFAGALQRWGREGVPISP